MLKRLARFTAHHLGASDVLQRLNENCVRVLMYHRFPRHQLHGFKAQCEFLAARYTVVSLEEAVHRLQAGERPRNMAVITVDDGYADFYESAWPILRAHRLTATLFVTTGFINQVCWMTGDRVRYHFDHCSDEAIGVVDDAGHSRTFHPTEANASDELRTFLKSVSETTKKHILSELEAKVPLPDTASVAPAYRACTWHQLRELAGNGISIGAHTVTHPILSRLGKASDVEREIVCSKKEVEKHLQRPATLFAYPNGMRQDFDQISIDCVRANFTAAVTAINGMNAPATDPHHLLRLPCEAGHPIPQFARLLAGPLPHRRVETLLPMSRL